MFNRKVLGVALVALVSAGIYARARHRVIAPLSEDEQKRKTCEVHGDELQLATLVILYGDRGPVVTDFIAKQRDFPRSNSYAMGGCMVSPDSPKWREVKYCPHCREAEAHWLNAHHVSIPND